GRGQVVEGGVDVGQHAPGGQRLHVGRDHRHVAVAELGSTGAVEEVGGDRHPALGGEAAGDVFDVVVDAERLLHHDDAAVRLPGRFVDRQRSLLTHARDSTPGSRSPSPRAKRRRMRHTPLRSSRAVVTRSTRESGSSTQSTSTSWIRSPLCSASTRAWVEENFTATTIGGTAVYDLTTAATS